MGNDTLHLEMRQQAWHYCKERVNKANKITVRDLSIASDGHNSLRSARLCLHQALELCIKWKEE